MTAKEFARVRRQPILVCVGLVGPLILLPPIALGLAWVLRLSPEVAAGLLLVAACPIGGISNTYSYLARASTALSVTLTGLSCLLAGVTMPVLGRALDLASGQSLELSVPIPSLLAQLLLMLTLPVAIGMWLRRRWADQAVRHRPALERLAFVGVGIVLALIILDDPRAFADDLPSTVPLAAIFIALSAAAGWLAAAVVTRDPRD